MEELLILSQLLTRIKAVSETADGGDQGKPENAVSSMWSWIIFRFQFCKLKFLNLSPWLHETQIP